MKNSDYWKDRFETLEKESTNKSLEKLKEIEKAYNKAIRDVEKDLNYWYSRFADANNVSLSEAKTILDKGELDAFKMSVEEYIEKGASLDPKWQAALEQASAKVHITRLEAMKIQMQQHAEECAAQMSMKFKDYAKDIYADQYYKTAFEIQKGAGVGWEFKRINKDLINAVLSKPWAADGKNFSERIWDNRTKLVNELHNTLTSALARGQSPQKTIKELSTKLSNSKFNAGRVVMTESAFLRSAAHERSLKNLGVKQYEILATLDSKTSAICREMDGKVFNMSDYKTGVTAPPFHPFCRSTTSPHFDDDEEFFGGEDISDDMTFKEWEKKYLKDEPSKDKPQINPNVNKYSREALDFITDEVKESPYYKNLGDDNVKNMRALLKKNATDDQVKIWLHAEKFIGVKDTKAKGIAHFSPQDEGIVFNLQEDMAGSYFRAPYQVSFHEFGHNIDHLVQSGIYQYYSSSYKGGIFQKTIIQEVRERQNILRKELKKICDSMTAEEWWDYQEKHTDNWVWRHEQNKNVCDAKTVDKFLAKQINDKVKENPRMWSIISDLVGGATKGRVETKAGHIKAYWKDERAVAHEAFAEFWQLIAEPEQLDNVKEWFPKSYEIFNEMLKNLAARIKV